MKALICPLCFSALAENLQGLACSRHHQFDRAKEGYFNLLPVHHKNSREPGDAKEQLLARREFLAAGYFLPLLERLQQLIPAGTASLLDIGCGEGYFTRGLAAVLPGADIYGVDIAKAGIRLAAKSDLATTYAVASSHALPLASESMEIITRIYAPSKDEELARVLLPRGRLIIVTPGERHLLGLRKQIYQQIRPHPQPVAPKGFLPLEVHRVSYELNLAAGEHAMALLQMTPFAWKLSDSLRERCCQIGLNDDADFQIAIYQKASY